MNKILLSALVVFSMSSSLYASKKWTYETVMEEAIKTQKGNQLNNLIESRLRVDQNFDNIKWDLMAKNLGFPGANPEEGKQTQQAIIASLKNDNQQDEELEKAIQASLKENQKVQSNNDDYLNQLRIAEQESLNLHQMKKAEIHNEEASFQTALLLSQEEYKKSQTLKQSEELARKLQAEENARRHNTQNDQLIAEALQKKLNHNHAHKQDDQSFALALKLHQEELNKSRGRVVIRNTPTLKISDDIIEGLNAANQDFPKAQQFNVHTFNKKLAIKYTGLVSKIIQQLNLKTDTNPKEYPKILNSMNVEKNDQDFQKSLATFNKHNMSVVESAETKVNIAHLLSAILDLRERLKKIGVNSDFLLIESFCENYKTRGGCKPGWAGRAIRDFIRLGGTYIRSCPRVPKNTANSNN